MHAPLVSGVPDAQQVGEAISTEELRLRQRVWASGTIHQRAKRACTCEHHIYAAVKLRGMCTLLVRDDASCVCARAPGAMYGP